MKKTLKNIKKNSYIFVAIVALISSFILQIIWVINIFHETTDKISQEIDDMLVNALFEEVNIRSIQIPVGTIIKKTKPVNNYSAYNNYQYLNDGVTNILHKDINIDSLAKYIDKRKAESFDYDYILYKVYKNGASKVVYKSEHQPSIILTSIKSGLIPTRGDGSQNIQIAFLNPYNIFIKEMGLIIISSFILSLLLIWS